MSQLLFFYVRPEPGTWVYLSVFLLIGVFFVFHRFWSVRNLDILLLVLLTPGILLVYEGRKVRRLSPTVPTNSVTFRGHPAPLAAGNPAKISPSRIRQSRNRIGLSSHKILLSQSWPVRQRLKREVVGRLISWNWLALPQY